MVCPMNSEIDENVGKMSQVELFHFLVVEVSCLVVRRYERK